MPTVLRDATTVFRRQLRINLRNPAWLVLGAAQPVLYLLLFAPLLKPLTAKLGADDPLAFFVPGLVVQLGLFGALYVGFGLLAEWRDGVIEAERVTPASRVALLLGRLARDVFQLLVQCLILVGLAYVLGMRASLAGAALGIVLALLLGAAGSALSNAIALRTKSEELMAPLINMVTMPVLLLSGILLPMTLGPGWLQRISDVLPTRHVVDGVRAAFAGDLTSHSLQMGIGVTAALLVIGIWSATHAFRRDDV